MNRNFAKRLWTHFFTTELRSWPRLGSCQRGKTMAAMLASPLGLLLSDCDTTAGFSSATPISTSLLIILERIPRSALVLDLVLPIINVSSTIIPPIPLMCHDAPAPSAWIPEQSGS